MIPFRSKPRRPAESCASRCQHECGGLDVASCVLHCSTPHCEPHCCGCSNSGATECDGCGHCGAGDPVPDNLAPTVDGGSYLLGQGATPDEIVRLYEAAGAFRNRVAAWYELYTEQQPKL